MPALVSGRKREFGAIPPWTAEGTIFRHREQRKVFADWIARSRNITQILAVVRVGISFVGNKGSHNGSRHSSRMPAVRLVSRLRDLLAPGQKQTGRLQRPALVQKDFRIR